VSWGCGVSRVSLVYDNNERRSMARRWGITGFHLEYEGLGYTKII
jgi:hypothetical protein